MNTKQKKGFTLIELLVVISIIALLLALLMPALGKARNLAMIATCSGQEKQWGLVVAQYTNDYKSMYWQSWRYDTAESTKVLWWLVTYRYYQNPNFLFCPAAKLPLAAENSGAGSSDRAWGGTTGLTWCPMRKPGVKNKDGSPAYWNSKGSYGVNGWVANKTDHKGQPYSSDNRYFRTTNVRAGNTIPLIGDAAWNESNPGTDDEPPLYKDDPMVLNNPQGQIGRFCLDRHKGKDVWLFVDGSVRSVGIKELFALIWHNGYEPKKSRFTWSYYQGTGNPANLWPAWMKGFKEYMDK